MLDIWMRSIARAGGVEIPPNRHIVVPKAQPLPLPEPQPRVDGPLVKAARWLQARLVPPVRLCEVYRVVSGPRRTLNVWDATAGLE